MKTEQEISELLSKFAQGYSENDFDLLSSVFADEFEGELTQETGYSGKTREEVKSYFAGIAEKRATQSVEFPYASSAENQDGTTRVVTTAVVDFENEDGVQQPTKFLQFDMDINDQGEIVRFKSDSTAADPRLEFPEHGDNCTFD